MEEDWGMSPREDEELWDLTDEEDHGDGSG